MTVPGVRLAVLQPTSLCNLNCSYCYVPGRREAGLMGDDTIAAAAAFVFASAPQQGSFRFLWHAGEPLTAGLPFYRRAFAIIAGLAPPRATVTHVVQTNGTLVSDAWCDLFTEHGVHVGLSIDGPADLHDATRRTWAGRGSHARVMRGYRLLRERGIDPGALCVLTRESLSRPDDVYDFFVAEGFASVGFNVEEAEGEHATSSLGRDPAARVRADYAAFMRRFWRRWRTDDGRLRVREFQQELSCVREFQADPAFVREPDEVIPFGIVTIRKDGGISTFAPELASSTSETYADFVIGNVLDADPAQVLAGEPFRRLADDVARGRDACRRSCAYYAMCGGGFQSNRIAEHGSLLATETTTCRVHRQALTDTILDELTRESKALALTQ